MASLIKKKIDRPTRNRIILICIILVLDLILLPWVIQFPGFLVQDLRTAPSEWFAFGIFNSIKMIFISSQYRKIYICLQLLVMAIIIKIAWDVDRLKKKNRILDGVGGPEPAGDGQFGTSRWQNEKEMDTSCSVWYTDTPIKKGGIIFGMEKVTDTNEKVWLNDEDTHTMLLATTRMGKSRKVIMPSIWELAKAQESMILGDPKGELYITCKPYLEKEGYEVIALNLREPLKGNQWNMLDLINKEVDKGNIAKATEYAWAIANAIVNQAPATSSEPIWKNGEQSTIAALTLLASLESEFKFQRHMSTAYYLLAEYGQPLEDETVPLLEYIKSLPVKHPAKAAFATANIAPYKTRASFFTSALADLRLFSDPTISDMTSKQDHDLESVGIKKTAVFLIIPDEDKTRNVLATLYIDQVYQALVALANKRGGRIPKRVNIILDEFGNLPPIPEFDSKLTVAGGRGIRFCIALQDVTQLKKLYDKNAQTITGNCHNWIYIKTADTETAKIISEKTGKYTVETDNLSHTAQSKGHSSTHGTSTTGRPLLMSDEVLRWNPDLSLILPINHFPARYELPDLSAWSANKDFGFVATGDIDTDKELNRQIIEKRWDDIGARELQEVSIWLPEILTEEDLEGGEVAATIPTEELHNNVGEEFESDNEEISNIDLLNSSVNEGEESETFL
ncbi:VirD4-like conjugal transfer protein, CD1115 family [Clostridium butyricum]|uniref:VirD4-like conjugal transfer protein, CD1115 family n=1 Tax=Clostridium butyricum TaxID=1492 RepID=UPI00374EF7F1